MSSKHYGKCFLSIIFNSSNPAGKMILSSKGEKGGKFAQGHTLGLRTVDSISWVINTILQKKISQSFKYTEPLMNKRALRDRTEVLKKKKNVKYN